MATWLPEGRVLVYRNKGKMVEVDSCFGVFDKDMNKTRSYLTALVSISIRMMWIEQGSKSLAIGVARPISYYSCR